MAEPGSADANLDAILATAEHDRKRLNSDALGAFSLTLLGVASVVGAGIFVVTGDAAAHYAGPAVLISFVLAGIVAGLTALCYAELASMIPAAGSTYSYAFAAFGPSSAGSSAGTCCSSTCSPPRPSPSAGRATSSA